MSVLLVDVPTPLCCDIKDSYSRSSSRDIVEGPSQDEEESLELGPVHIRIWSLHILLHMII